MLAVTAHVRAARPHEERERAGKRETERARPAFVGLHDARYELQDALGDIILLVIQPGRERLCDVFLLVLREALLGDPELFSEIAGTWPPRPLDGGLSSAIGLLKVFWESEGVRVVTAHARGHAQEKLIVGCGVRGRGKKTDLSCRQMQTLATHGRDTKAGGRENPGGVREVYSL